MEFEQLTIRLTPMPRDQVSVAILRATYRVGRKPQLELVSDTWVEPGQVAGHIEPWVAYAAQLSYDQQVLPDVTAGVVLPLRPPR
jgi:hypothetical protein